MPPPHGAPERLEVSEELAEAGEIPAPASRASVTTLVEQIHAIPRVAEPLPNVAPPAGRSFSLPQIAPEALTVLQ